MADAVLSPHLDDAVLSCWHVLCGADAVVVVNVFSGVPSAGTALGWWDRLTRADDAAARVRARIREDREALALAGRFPVNLGLLDGQHHGALEPAVVVDRLSEVGCAAVYAPAALGGHADHVLVRDAALVLRERGVRVLLYADLPHAIRHGWPALVSGDGDVRAGRLWREGLARAGPALGDVTPIVHVLDRAQQARKLAAVRAYRTQLRALDAIGFAPLSMPEVLRYEVTWALAPA
jgi:LmbE family N-acetylglucosaminyl deacetylase